MERNPNLLEKEVEVIINNFKTICRTQVVVRDVTVKLIITFPLNFLKPFVCLVPKKQTIHLEIHLHAHNTHS